MPMNKKKVMITVSAVVLVLGSIGIYAATRGKKNVEVVSVATLDGGYFGDPTSSSGVVYNAQDQSIFPDSTKTVSEIFVSAGQQVKTGDKLIAYDLSSLQLAAAVKKTAVETVKNEIASTKYKLQKLRNTVPIEIPEPLPIPTPEPLPSPTPETDKKKEKFGDAYTVLDQLTDAYDITYSNECSDIEPGSYPDYPLIFLVTEDGEIRSTLFQALEAELIKKKDELRAQLEEQMHLQPEDMPDDEKMTPEKIEGYLNDVDIWAAIEVHEDNAYTGTLVSRWLIHAKRLPLVDSDSKFPAPGYIAPEHAVEPLPEPDLSIEVEEPVIPEGYTAQELASMIKETEMKLKSLDLALRRKVLELEIDEESLSDGIVYAKHDGVVTRAASLNELPQDGSPLVTVSGAQGTYVQGEISELMLDQVKNGTMVTVTNWNTGSSYEAEVTSIDTYPTNSGSYYGGNPNASYYQFVGHIADDTDLKNGDPLDIQIQSEAEQSDAMWIDMLYIREENGSYYVMKDDHGKLKKQPIQLGRTLFGMTGEILGGITREDKIAFPYGKNVKEGAPTVFDEEGGMQP